MEKVEVQMKVLMVDLYNIQNYFYLLTKFLRKKGVEADMLLASNMQLSDSPSWHDSSVKDSLDYPSWIKWCEFPLHLFENPLRYLRKELEVIKFIKNYDLIVCSGLAPIWIQWADRPFVFISLGSDLEQIPFYGMSGDPKKFSDLEIKERVKYFLIKHLMRRGLKKAEIIAFMLPHLIEIVGRLRLKKLKFLPLVLDTELFKPMDDLQREEEKKQLKEKLKCELILFQSTRHVWINKDVSDSADYKGNDKLFRAFAKFLQKTKKGVKLIVIEKGWDIEESKKLIDELGIAGYVIWKKPMNKLKLVWYYNVADICFDNFGLGAFALSAAEPMACGTPVFSYVESAPDGFFYPEMPPVINVRTEDEIFTHLWELAEDDKKRDEIGKNSLEWIKKYCSWEESISKHLELYKEIMFKNKDREKLC